MDKIQQSISWANKRLELQGKKLDATQIDILTFILRASKNDSKEEKFIPRKVGLSSVRGRKDFFELWQGKGKDRKLIAWFVYHGYMKPKYWLGYTVSYHENNTSNSTLVFKGNIPDNNFAKQLIKNILI